MAFGQSGARIISQQITVIKMRRWEAQSTVQQQLPGGGLQQICSSYDFADLHGMVIGNDRKLVRRNIVSAPDYKVAKVASRHETLCSQTLVEKGDLLPFRNPEAPVHTSRSTERSCILSQAAIPRIEGLVIGIVGRGCRQS
jgi:hypothetical protein